MSGPSTVTCESPMSIGDFLGNVSFRRAGWATEGLYQGKR